jgi:hypothetical protein
MNRGFTNEATQRPLVQKAQAGFAQGKAMAEQRQKPTDGMVKGTTNSTRTGLLNP